jgi:hypothetical protein
MMSESKGLSGVSMLVSYDLLGGELLVNGIPVEQARPEYHTQPLDKTLFDFATVEVMLATLKGFQFSTKRALEEYGVQVDMLNEKDILHTQTLHKISPNTKTHHSRSFLSRTVISLPSYSELDVPPRMESSSLWDTFVLPDIRPVQLSLSHTFCFLSIISMNATHESAKPETHDIVMRKDLHIALTLRHDLQVSVGRTVILSMLSFLVTGFGRLKVTIERLEFSTRTCMATPGTSDTINKTIIW